MTLGGRKSLPEVFCRCFSSIFLLSGFRTSYMTWYQLESGEAGDSPPVSDSSGGDSAGSNDDVESVGFDDEV